jgi:hypothetical protein
MSIRIQPKQKKRKIRNARELMPTYRSRRIPQLQQQQHHLLIQEQYSILQMFQTEMDALQLAQTEGYSKYRNSNGSKASTKARNSDVKRHDDSMQAEVYLQKLVTKI